MFVPFVAMPNRVAWGYSVASGLIPLVSTISLFPCHPVTAPVATVIIVGALPQG